jgi:hypothetical protein
VQWREVQLISSKCKKTLKTVSAIEISTFRNGFELLNARWLFRQLKCKFCEMLEVIGKEDLVELSTEPYFNVKMPHTTSDFITKQLLFYQVVYRTFWSIVELFRTISTIFEHFDGIINGRNQQSRIAFSSSFSGNLLSK